MADTGKVLVVDDELISRTTLGNLLKQEGHSLTFAENGTEALQKADQLLPDVILLDVMMPEIDGYEVCRRLKSNPKTAHIPVLLATMLTERRHRLNGIEAGANDFLTKPLDPTDLRLRVRNAVRAKHLYDQLQQSYDKLKELEKLRDSLTQMIVHDMYSLLTAMLGSLKLLTMNYGEKHSEKEKRYIDLVYLNTRRLCKMVNDVLDVSRLEAGEMPLNRTRSDLVKLTQDTVKAFESLAGQRPLLLDLPAEPVLVWCDADLTQRVIGNLLSNAFKHTPEQSEICVAVSREQKTATFRIKDAGPGIPPEYHQKIFEKFVQVPAEGKRDKEGMGLGLAFCKLVVSCHGGDIGLQSEVGKGSTFWFTLPLMAL